MNKKEILDKILYSGRRVQLCIISILIIVEVINLISNGITPLFLRTLQMTFFISSIVIFILFVKSIEKRNKKFEEEANQWAKEHKEELENAEEKVLAG